MKVDDWGVVAYQNIFNRLVKQTISNDVVGDLAESWGKFSEDGLTLTFHLHSGVKWHDGEPFSSKTSNGRSIRSAPKGISPTA